MIHTVQFLDLSFRVGVGIGFGDGLSHSQPWDESLLF
jgi:hypothetical protein